MKLETYNFSVVAGIPATPAEHAHNEVEVSVFEGAPVSMLYGGRCVDVQPGHLIVHWGILPHGALRHNAAARVVGIRVPLAWVLGWDLPKNIRNRILNLDVLIDGPRTAPCPDSALLEFWANTLKRDPENGQDIVLLELRSRLLQLGLARSLQDMAASEEVVAGTSSGAFERAAAFIAANFSEPIHIRDVAHAAGVTPRHLTRLFRNSAGYTINQHIARLRVMDAQRQLVTTNRKVLDIMYACGFCSPTRFYEVFKKHAHCTPSRYRREQRAERARAVRPATR